MGFNPAGDSLRKYVECASGCPTDGCRWAVGAPMALAKPVAEKETQGLKVRSWQCVWEARCDGSEPRGGLKGHGTGH